MTTVLHISSSARGDESATRSLGNALAAGLAGDDGTIIERHLTDGVPLLTDEVGGKVLYPEPQFCTDNGAMIAYAGHLRLKSGQRPPHPLAIEARARWSLEQLSIIGNA